MPFWKDFYGRVQQYFNLGESHDVPNGMPVNVQVSDLIPPGTIIVKNIGEPPPKSVTEAEDREWLKFVNGSRIRLREPRTQYGLILPASGPIQNEGLEIPGAPPFFYKAQCAGPLDISLHEAECRLSRNYEFKVEDGKLKLTFEVEQLAMKEVFNGRPSQEGYDTR